MDKDSLSPSPPWSSPYERRSIDYSRPSFILSMANENNRLKQVKKLLALRDYSDFHYLINPSFRHKVLPKPLFSINEALEIVDNIMPSLDISIESNKIKLNNRNYNIYLFDYQGHKYWHPFGNIITYRFEKHDRQLILKYAKKHFPDRRLPEGFNIGLDHVIPEIFANAMNIEKSESVSVLVPKFANGVRTNNKELVKNFTVFDWRIGLKEKRFNENDGLNKLVEDRLNQAFVRVMFLYIRKTKARTALLKSNTNINLNIFQAIYPQIGYGYNQAYQQDMEYYYKAFCNQFDISPNTEDSIFAFYNQLLLQGGERDLTNAQKTSVEYFKKLSSNKNMIAPEYFINQMTTAHLNQNVLSKQIQSFIPSIKYREYSQKVLDSQFYRYDDIIETLIKNFQDSFYTIDIKKVEELRSDFKKIKIIQVTKMDKENLFEKIFSGKIAELGNFYKKKLCTGQMLNLSVTRVNVADFNFI